ncbi:MAG: SDR family oxidoreductase [Bacteroidetes bacterium]|nr:MAG: SDR family oxidoreductase [Bacteroidota bacterium]
MSGKNRIAHKKVVVTGGAGFIGSNLCEELLSHNNHVVCFDNLSTGFKENILHLLDHPSFEFLEGDIRDLDTCKRAVSGADIVLHQAALGSVPRSIHDPLTTNSVNIDGFLNMLIAARDEGIKRFVYAASSSTYGDSTELPKVEEKIGNPLSPYAVTKYVNELYASVFSKNYGMEVIGLRYFNVFGRRQSPSGAYAAVIPKFVEAFIRLEAPVINGDGSFSRDFTYIDNVIEMNHLAATTENPEAIGEVYNTACGEQMSLNDLANELKTLLSAFNPEISNIEVIHGPERKGDIPHSLASIEKARRILQYNPSHSVSQGLKEAIQWYWDHLS